MRNYNAMKAAKNLLSRVTWQRAYVYEEDTTKAEESIAKVLRKAYNAGKRDEQEYEQAQIELLAGKHIREQYDKHWFSGSENGKCLSCNLSPHRGNHFRNGGVVCDNPDGPCACGAWHHNGKPH